MKKRILSLLLALVMLAGLLPASVLAANQEPPSVTAYFSLTDDDQYVVGDNAARRQPPFSCVLRRTSPNKHPFSKKHTLRRCRGVYFTLRRNRVLLAIGGFFW